MADTRQRIIDAAIDVFNDDPSAPLEKAAEKAAVTRRTLHRYFKDRNDLLSACSNDIRKRCSKAMNDVLDRPDAPLLKLEQLLYAAIDCGTKFASFHKLHNSGVHVHHGSNADCAAYDAMRLQFLHFIGQLQEQGSVSRQLTAEWIHFFFSSLVDATVKADTAGAVARLSQKQFAWFSFSKGIGILTSEYATGKQL